MKGKQDLSLKIQFKKIKKGDENEVKTKKFQTECNFLHAHYVDPCMHNGYPHS